MFFLLTVFLNFSDGDELILALEFMFLFVLRLELPHFSTAVQFIEPVDCSGGSGRDSKETDFLGARFFSSLSEK